MAPSPPASQRARGVEQQTRELFHHYSQTIYRRTDRWFLGLLLFQWLAGVVLAGRKRTFLTVSPGVWPPKFVWTTH